ncbi:MAG: ribbon-helix-helix protein, CopG family [Dermatophilaceae bacterium]
MTLRTDAELDAALDALSGVEGVSKQEVIRRAVLDRAARRDVRDELDAILDDQLPRFADALERLGR